MFCYVIAWFDVDRCCLCVYIWMWKIAKGVMPICTIRKSQQMQGWLLRPVVKQHYIVIMCDHVAVIEQTCPAATAASSGCTGSLPQQSGFKINSTMSINKQDTLPCMYKRSSINKSRLNLSFSCMPHCAKKCTDHSNTNHLTMLHNCMQRQVELWTTSWSDHMSGL